jgi:2-polyprenyl-6-methoxyphenol hydroxylase-like FAD-dependent oxidoreductase
MMARPHRPRAKPAERDRNGHAVVIGGGMAGLLATAVLAEFFEHVTVLERSSATDRHPWPSGAPQARYPHLLLARGRQIMEELFPGLNHDLSQAGAPVFDFGQRARILTPAGPTPTPTTDIICQASSRFLMESLLHARAQKLPGVVIRTGTTVTGLRVDPSTRAVTGVTCTRRADPSRQSPEELAADLVVDAGGRHSRLPDWLTQHGWPRPRTTVIDPRLGYAVRSYTIPAGLDLGFDVLSELTRAPAHTRGCLGLRIEEDQFLLSLHGAGGDYPPSTENEFAAFAASLRSDLPALLAQLTPSSPIFCYRRTPNRRHHYDRIRPWPNGLIVLGDAACVFNPVYAQGITVAATHALALRDLLTHAGGDDRLTSLTRFQRRQARLSAWPWLLSTCLDHDWNPHTAALPGRAVSRTLDALLGTLPDSPADYTRFFAVLHMLAPPYTLLHPATVRGILTHLRRREDTHTGHRPATRNPTDHLEV